MKQIQKMKVFKFQHNKKQVFTQQGSTPPEPTEPETPQSTDRVKEYTEDEVRELLNTNPFAQSEIDRRIRSANETNKKNLEVKFNQTLEEKKLEWEEEARLAQQGVELSDDDVVKQLQKKIYELERTNLTKEAEAELVKKNIPTYFATFVTGKDVTETNQNIEKLNEQLTEYVSSVKKANLRGVTPKTNPQTSVSKNENKKVSDITDEQELMKRFGHLRK